MRSLPRWSLLFASLAVGITGAVAAANATRFSFLHTFSVSENASTLSTLVSEEAAIAECGSDVVIVTTADRNTSLAVASEDASLVSMLKNYTLVSDNRVAFKSTQWQAVREVSLHNSVWTRLKASSTPDVCIAVVPAFPIDFIRLLDVMNRLSSFCAPRDIVFLGFTGPLTDELAQYVTAKLPVNGQYVPRPMVETSAFAQQTPQSAAVDSRQAVNRLFFSTPANAPACLERPAGSMTVRASDLNVRLCFGSECKCDGIGETSMPVAVVGPEDSSSSDSRRGLVVLLSCGSFLLGCALVFYVFFHKQFFLPSESTKPEKELTTNLAYVLRV